MPSQTDSPDAQENDSPSLRVVLLIDGFSRPRWEADCVAEMLGSDVIDIVGVFVNGRSDVPQPGSSLGTSARLRRIWQKREAILFERYLRFDRARYPAIGADPFESTDLTKMLAGVPLHVVQPRQTAFSDFFDTPSLQRLEDLACDVAIRFGFRILRGPVLGLPRYGVWSFHHGDNGVNRGGPAGVWEVLLGWPATGAVLQRLSEDLYGGQTLARTWTATEPISINQNRVTLYRATAPLLGRKLHELQRRGAVALKHPVEESPYLPYCNRLFVAPRARELLGGMGRIVSRLAGRKLMASRMREQWQLAWGTDPKQQPTNDVPQASMFRLRPIVPPQDRFWADPFPVEHGGRHFVFLEELVYSENRGTIAVVEMDSKGMIASPKVVLDLPYHLSYPFVFRHDGRWFLMPEMASRAEQEVYVARDFPYEWELHSSFSLGRPVVDATILHDGTRWWLFAGSSSHALVACNELLVFHGESPLGPWHAHAQNPVITDARCARPAGRMFRVGGEIIRPAQDGTPAYGTAIVFKRITKLTPDEYAEEQIGRIDPKWHSSVAGVHTINAAGSLTVIDARVRVPR